MPLTIRTLFFLKTFGLENGILLVDRERDLSGFRRWVGGLELRQVPAPGDKEDEWAVMAPFADSAQSFLYVNAAHLFDSRILEALYHETDTVIAFGDPAERKAHVLRAGFFTGRDFLRLCRRGPAGVVEDAAPLYPEMIDPFCPDIRGPLSPCMMEVRSKQQARQATRILIAAQQKRVMDFPSEFIDPPLENFLTRILCGLPVTPNMVTAFGVVVAVAAAWCFLKGAFLTGAVIAFGLEILDGVDGKLARTKLYFTRIGEQEALIDYVCENGLYAALGIGLSSGEIGPPMLMAGLLILADTTDNIFYTLGQKYLGKAIDLFSPFDAGFRRIAGRRNIYTLMFLVGFAAGYPVHTLGAAASWAVVTALIHGIRLTQHWRRSRAAIEGAAGGRL